MIPLEESIQIPILSNEDPNVPHFLEARIHHGGLNSNIGVILSHPYGPLGGDLHHPVIRHLTLAMAKMGLSTLRYNMRGVGQSTKKTSWTGHPETNDLIQLIQWWTTPSDRRQGSFQDEEGLEQPRSVPTQLILVGYSYGALITLPSMVHEAFVQPPTLFLALISVSLPTRLIPLLTCFHSSMFYPTLPSRLPKLFVVGDQDPFSSLPHLLKYVEHVCGTTSTQREHASTSTPFSQNIQMERAPTTLNADVLPLSKLDHFMVGQEERVVMCIERWIQNILKTSFSQG
ncbi:hypothetical protein HMI54_015011 [Coelomomyces lativittatus]|nr:hypothetical protein HMI54_015011 [Coelomomyces lativittatus]KAJ1515796.1 hypothetical protein HMI56_000794 [Coelomomyces lativittatus]KAJ1518064.1 hypothetical protein HMI55_003417 [Coelomomyces lativittatus]